MRNLLPGIVDFRRRILPKIGLDVFHKLAKKQQFAESLFIACSDSRMVPNLFVSTNPGELFVIRNIGNIIPVCHRHHTHIDTSVGAAIEFSNLELKVKDIIVCGHSQCGAMKGLLEDNPDLPKTRPHLASWLTYAKSALHKLKEKQPIQFVSPHNNKVITVNIDQDLDLVNQLSQINVLQQVEHLASYKIVKERMARGELMLHGWWFDIGKASVYSFSENKGCYVLIDEMKAIELLHRAKESRESIKQRIQQKGEVPPWILNKEHFERAIVAPWSRNGEFHPPEDLLNEVSKRPDDASAVLAPWAQREHEAKKLQEVRFEQVEDLDLPSEDRIIETPNSTQQNSEVKNN